MFWRAFSSHTCLSSLCCRLPSSTLLTFSSCWSQLGPEATLALHGGFFCSLFCLWILLDSGFLHILLPGHFEQGFETILCLKTSKVLVKAFQELLEDLFLGRIPLRNPELRCWGHLPAVFSTYPSLSGQFLSLQASLKTFFFSSVLFIVTVRY